jgi:hypothetical protein
MFKKLSRAAERAATSVSRRQFLSHCGRGALAVASLLVLPGINVAGPAACGPNSTPGCRGKPAGSRCNIGRNIGVCAAAPSCTCRISRRD